MVPRPISREQRLRFCIEPFLRGTAEGGATGDWLTDDTLDQAIQKLFDRVFHALVVLPGIARRLSFVESRRFGRILDRLLQSGVFVLVPAGTKLANISRDAHLVTYQGNGRDISGVADKLGVRHDRIVGLDFVEPNTDYSTFARQFTPEQAPIIFALNRLNHYAPGPPIILPVRTGRATLTGLIATKYILNTLPFCRRLRMRETTTEIQDGSILNRLDSLAALSKKNLRKSLNLANTGRIRTIEPNIFDHRSGAIYFKPEDWRTLLLTNNREFRRLLNYFDAELPSYWQPGRPCKRRILWTPSKVLLRGEAYYTNMRNASPIDRIRLISDELIAISALGPTVADMIFKLPARQLDNPELFAMWKLLLGYLDQLRNASLQLFAFIHATHFMAQRLREWDIDCPVASKVSSLAFSKGDKEGKLYQLVRLSVHTYFTFLMHLFSTSRSDLLWACDAATLVTNRLKGLCSKLEAWLGDLDPEKCRPLISGLVRRWREADHPGENALVAISALGEIRGGRRVAAVGIGWGGIELPLVLECFATYFRIGRRRRRQVDVFIANYSHYRDQGAEIYWIGPMGTRAPDFADKEPLLFDDNVLTGFTLERVRDAMLLNGSEIPKMFVVRYSGERRWAQMKMPNHGVMDPAVMRREVGGYLGETSYARSWSTKEKDYVSPIGVFSLSRRRILECIHNNSTVDGWDREGF